MTSYRADKPKVDGRTDGGNDITPSAEVPRGKNELQKNEYMSVIETVFDRCNNLGKQV